MNKQLNIYSLFKNLFSRLIICIKKVFNYVQKKLHSPKTLQGKYKCKMNNIPTKVIFGKKDLLIHKKNSIESLYFDKIKQVYFEVKWWRIRVRVMSIQNNYAFDFGNYKKARFFYEQLIYKKIESNL